MRVAGIMSGTSLDGIDVAIVDIEAREGSVALETVATFSQPYADDVRTALLDAASGEASVAETSQLHFLLAQLYADAFLKCCKKASLDTASVELIGCHGQTIYHQGQPSKFHGKQVASTLQIGDGSVLAELTGISVVSDFRPRDIAAGGQGAPLVPFVDWLLFRDSEQHRALLNIGGIANVTLVPAGCQAGDVLAFDTGPGNMVIDQLAAHFSGNAKRCDENGEMASQGLVDPTLVATLMNDRFYSRKPPKSAGREQFGAEFVQSLLKNDLPPADLVATATHLTAATIADAICNYFPGGALEDADDEDDGGDESDGSPLEVIASGGGVHNPVLMEFLRLELPSQFLLTTAADYGIDPDFKEAIAFAVLARETWLRRPSNLPSATGARRAVVLGKVSY
jgi:anhydro-N-acetylmuramic acid kinase